MSDSTTQTITAAPDSVTTRLVTSLTYLGAGPRALDELQERLDDLTGPDNRIILDPITTDTEGRPVCGLSFNCDSYDPPIDGEPDPRALEDLRSVLRQINYDGCVFWNTIDFLTAEPIAA